MASCVSVGVRGLSVSWPLFFGLRALSSIRDLFELVLKQVLDQADTEELRELL